MTLIDLRDILDTFIVYIYVYIMDYVSRPALLFLNMKRLSSVKMITGL